MKEESFGQLLEQKGLKKTKVRMALLQHFMQVEHAQSYNGLQRALGAEIEKSTLYRNLASFERAGIIHSINDHTGVTKYAFGRTPKKGAEHAHFVCQQCQTVYCIDASASIQPHVPEGFKTKSVQTIVKGVCSKC